MFRHTLFLPCVCICLSIGLANGFANAGEMTRLGDIEVHGIAVPTTELTPEAAREYNITPAAGRGLLTVTLVKKGAAGNAESVPGQVYAGGFTQKNTLFSVPIREIRQSDGVFYLGEFRYNAPDTIRFLVNANVLGKPMKMEFARAFSTP